MCDVSLVCFTRDDVGLIQLENRRIDLGNGIRENRCSEFLALRDLLNRSNVSACLLKVQRVQVKRWTYECYLREHIRRWRSPVVLQVELNGYMAARFVERQWSYWGGNHFDPWALSGFQSLLRDLCLSRSGLSLPAHRISRSFCLNQSSVQNVQSTQTSDGSESSENVQASGNVKLADFVRAICFLPLAAIGVAFVNYWGTKRGIFAVMIGGWLAFVASGFAFFYFLVLIQG